MLPYTNMIYIGDGETDVPCMKTIKLHGGNSICVYNPKSEKKQKIAMKRKKESLIKLL